MRLVLSGATQLLYSVLVAADSRWPHVNVQQCKLYFPDQSIEIGNAGASVKVGGAGMTTDMTDVWDVLTEGDKKDMLTQGSLLNGVSLKSTYLRGSANNTILIVEPHIG